MSDSDTEEALAEFDFLVSVSHDGAGEARSHVDTDWGNVSVLYCSVSGVVGHPFLIAYLAVNLYDW